MRPLSSSLSSYPNKWHDDGLDEFDNEGRKSEFRKVLFKGLPSKSSEILVSIRRDMKQICVGSKKRSEIGN